jgi:hypothetical protein
VVQVVVHAEVLRRQEELPAVVELHPQAEVVASVEPEVAAVLALVALDPMGHQVALQVLPQITVAAVAAGHTQIQLHLSVEKSVDLAAAELELQQRAILYLVCRNISARFLVRQIMPILSQHLFQVHVQFLPET